MRIRKVFSLRDRHRTDGKTTLLQVTYLANGRNINQNLPTRVY